MKNLGKVFAVASLCFVVIGIILALVLVPKKQETRSKAAFTARLYFNPNSSLTAPIQVQKGSSVSVDLMLDPGTSTVSFTRFYVNYDATKLTYNTISINTNAFPVTLEGPVQSSGLIAGAVSIGSDATRAITTPTVVATLTFTASNSTTTPTQLTFGSQSMVLSIGSDSQSNENVLSTTSPAFITINEPPTPIPTSTPIPTATPTPRPTNTPLPTATPTPLPTSTPLPTATPTPLPTNTPLPTATPTPRPTNTPLPTSTPTPLPTSTPLPTATPRPTNTPTPVPSATPIPHTFIAYNVFLHGLGNSGDNANPTAFSLSNKNPLRPQKDFGVQIFDNLNVQIASYSGVITYNSTTGTFVGSIDLGTNIANGVYLLKVKSSQYLRSQYDSLIALVPGQTVTLPDITLVAGDTNNDNQLSILDYNMIYGCYATPLFPTPRSCDSVRNLMADINDDGAVNQYDYNLFVRELSVQTGR